MLGANATPAEIRLFNIQNHLNEPFWVRYGQWLGGALHGQFGASLVSHQAVTTVIGQRLPVTFELVAYAFLVSVVFAVPVALAAARRPNGLADRLTMVISMAGLSTAPYVLALLLVFIFAVRLGWLPAIGFVPLSQSVPGNIKSLTLPAISIGFPLFCFYARLLRADIIEQMQGEDYVITAKAKGVGPWRILVRHGDYPHLRSYRGAREPVHRPALCGPGPEDQVWTDPVGNDILSRILYGGRVSIEVGVAANLIGLVTGSLLGIVAGYRGGALDAVVMRILDVLIAFPSLVLALAIAEGLGPSELHVIWALSFFTVPAFGRIARAGTLRLRGLTFMLAAELSGTRTRRMVLRHIVPNILPQLLTFGLLGIGVAIILEGALSFLGLGIPAPGPSWGNMIALGQGTLSATPGLVLIPSAFLFVTVLSLNLLGDALRARWGVR